MNEGANFWMAQGPQGPFPLKISRPISDGPSNNLDLTTALYYILNLNFRHANAVQNCHWWGLESSTTWYNGFEYLHKTSKCKFLGNRLWEFHSSNCFFYKVKYLRCVLKFLFWSVLFRYVKWLSRGTQILEMRKNWTSLFQNPVF